METAAAIVNHTGRLRLRLWLLRHSATADAEATMVAWWWLKNEHLFKHYTYVRYGQIRTHRLATAAPSS